MRYFALAWWLYNCGCENCAFQFRIARLKGLRWTFVQSPYEDGKWHIIWVGEFVKI